MNFLIVNDDGIDSPGLRALTDALAAIGDVYVAAPAQQQSGKSQSITLMNTVRIDQVQYYGAVRAWKVYGTPADCTRAGLQFVRDLGKSVDITFSGINLGYNLGADTLYSGTVGAAAEATLLGCHAVAVSVEGHHATHFKAACRLAVAVIPHVVGELPVTTVLNINTPDREIREIQGLIISSAGDTFYDDRFEEVSPGEYRRTGEPRDCGGTGNDTDTAASSRGYATITPLMFDYTDRGRINTIERWRLKL